MKSYFKRLASSVASLFRASKRETETTCREVSRRGSTAIVRNYKDCMFHVVDIMAEGGPELVGEYAIYRNAVRAAELWEQAKRHRVPTVPR